MNRRIYDERKVVVELLPEPKTKPVSGLEIPDVVKESLLAISKFVIHPYRGKVIFKHEDEGRFDVGDILWLRDIFGDWVRMPEKILMSIDVGKIIFVESKKGNKYTVTNTK
jgi:hypothetical protein